MILTVRQDYELDDPLPAYMLSEGYALTTATRDISASPLSAAGCLNPHALRSRYGELTFYVETGDKEVHIIDIMELCGGLGGPYANPPAALPWQRWLAEHRPDLELVAFVEFV
jgi:hypothetical protein